MVNITTLQLIIKINQSIKVTMLYFIHNYYYLIMNLIIIFQFSLITMYFYHKYLKILDCFKYYSNLYLNFTIIIFDYNLHFNYRNYFLINYVTEKLIKILHLSFDFS